MRLLSGIVALVIVIAVPATHAGQRVVRDADGKIRVEPAAVPERFRNPWTRELEKEFWQRANHAIRHVAEQAKGGRYGNTFFENEKRSYPAAMFDFLAGHRDTALAFLQREDNLAKENAHTLGIDLFPCFTLKGQMRKYFFFGPYLEPAYRDRMRKAAAIWTEQDPLRRPHPLYGKGDPSKQGWRPDKWGSWVDIRSTDNLRAMRETSVYLMAEETDHQDVRKLYLGRIRNYVTGLYHTGMSEWDSENYHGHTIAPYLNLYDFARDPEAKALAKAALDWLFAAGAVKYFRCGFGGPTKRDYGGANVVWGANVSHVLGLYFGDCPVPDPEPEPDEIHCITSAYRPPLAVVALARKQFDKPVELLTTKPPYAYPSAAELEKPEYWETLYLGHTYSLGSVVSAGPAGDVGPFKLMAANTKRGVDFFVANTGGDWAGPGKHAGDQIAQLGNSAIWLRPVGDEPATFCFQVPESATVELGGDIWFIRLETTWLALRPIGLSRPRSLAVGGKCAERYADEQTLRSKIVGKGYAGFALEVGEPQAHGGYGRFKSLVLTRSRLDLSKLPEGTATLTTTDGSTLTLTHNAESDLPTVIRNGEQRQWLKELDLYKPLGKSRPIALGWKQGTLRIEAGGHRFAQTVTAEGEVVPAGAGER